MEKKQFLECGKIVNTHGLRGEVKIQPWCNTPDFLLEFDRLFLDGTERRLLSARVHKGCVIAKLYGIDDVNAAMACKNKIVYINRDDADIGEDNWFIQDIIGLPVFTQAGEQLGVLREVLNLPASDVYVVQGEREYLIPAVDAFLHEVDVENGRIVVSIIEGM